MVALFHSGQATYLDASGKLAQLVDQPGVSWGDRIIRAVGNGPGAVIFFFALSGFVLTKALIESQGSPGFQSSFVRARLFRIYPAVFSTIALFGALYLTTGLSLSTPGEYTALGLVLNALLIRSTVDGVTWSLQVEVVAIPLLLVLFHLWRRFSAPALAVAALLLIPLSFVGEWNRLLAPQGGFGQIYAFIAGMGGYIYGRAWAARLNHPKAVLAIVLVLFAASRSLIGWSSFWTVLAESLACYAMIPLLAHIDAASKQLRLPLVSFIGTISFSFYLLHPLTLIAMSKFSKELTELVAMGVPRHILALSLFLISSAAITPLAWLQYKVVERPLIRIGKGKRIARTLMPSEVGA